MKCGRRNMIRVLNYFLECVKLWKILFHLNIHTPASNASTTTINTAHVLYFRHLRHAYHYMHMCILLNYLILYCVPSTPPTLNKTKKMNLHLCIFYLKVIPPIPTHCVPLSTRSYTCGTQSCAWIYAHPCTDCTDCNIFYGTHVEGVEGITL